MDGNEAREKKKREKRLKLVFLLGGDGDGVSLVCKLGARKKTEKKRNLDLSVRRHEETALWKIPQLVSWWVGEQPAQKRIEEKRVEMVRFGVRVCSLPASHLWAAEKKMNKANGFFMDTK